MNLVSQLAKIEIAQQKKEESEKAKVLSRIFNFEINDALHDKWQCGEDKQGKRGEVARRRREKAKSLAVVKDKVWEKTLWEPIHMISHGTGRRFK